METFNTINEYNIESSLTSIVYLAYKKLNKFMDADDVYDYIDKVYNKDTEKVEEFIDFIYENILIYYILEIDNIVYLNDMFYEKVINIAKEIIEKNEN